MMTTVGAGWERQEGLPLLPIVAGAGLPLRLHRGGSSRWSCCTRMMWVGGLGGRFRFGSVLRCCLFIPHWPPTHVICITHKHCSASVTGLTWLLPSPPPFSLQVARMGSLVKHLMACRTPAKGAAGGLQHQHQHKQHQQHQRGGGAADGRSHSRPASAAAWGGGKGRQQQGGGPLGRSSSVTALYRPASTGSGGGMAASSAMFSAAMAAGGAHRLPRARRGSGSGGLMAGLLQGMGDPGQAQGRPPCGGGAGSVAAARVPVVAARRSSSVPRPRLMSGALEDGSSFR